MAEALRGTGVSQKTMTLVCAVLLVLIGVWYVLTHEKVTRTQYIGY